MLTELYGVTAYYETTSRLIDRDVTKVRGAKIFAENKKR